MKRLKKNQKKLSLRIGHLYGDVMNIYGDNGNIITFQRRCEWRGINVSIEGVSLGYKLKKGEFDLYFFGGGQDRSQSLVAADLPENKGVLKEEIERGVPLLSICGGYQLLGEYYQPFDGPKLEGLGIFPAYTKASHHRMIGNLVIEIQNSKFKIQNYGNESSSSSYLVGFENHSGKTYLKMGGNPLGRVVKGFGNNGEDQTEGCVYKNAIGCYMHGSLLPKNPLIADFLLGKALEIKYGEEIKLAQLDDSLEYQAQEVVIKRFGG